MQFCLHSFRGLILFCDAYAGAPGRGSIFRSSKKLRLSPHHDPASAVGLSVIFGRAEDAKAFEQYVLGVQ